MDHIKPNRGGTQPVETCTKLPKSHKGKLIASIDLEKSAVLSRLIKIVSAVLAAVMFLAGYLLFPIDALLQMEDTFAHLVVLFFAMMSVFLLHELLRGFLMRLFSGVKPIIRYVGSYPQAACEAYFCRIHQQIINLLPLAVIISILLAIVLTTAEMSWKWIAWIALTVGICSYARDLYVAVRMLYMPKDILVMNVGPIYLIYSATGESKKEES